LADTAAAADAAALAMDATEVKDADSVTTAPETVFAWASAVEASAEAVDT
jgi:hypothetical protein